MFSWNKPFTLVTTEQWHLFISLFTCCIKKSTKWRWSWPFLHCTKQVLSASTGASAPFLHYMAFQCKWLCSIPYFTDDSLQNNIRRNLRSVEWDLLFERFMHRITVFYSQWIEAKLMLNGIKLWPLTGKWLSVLHVLFCSSLHTNVSKWWYKTWDDENITCDSIC